MATTGLFTAALEALDPENITRSHTVHGAKHLSSPAPTNAEIKQAALEVYHKHMNVVDTYARCGANYVRLPESKPHITILNEHDWKSQQIEKVIPTAKLIHASPHFAAAVQAARRDSDVLSLVYGISESAQFFIGEEGGTGVAIGLGGDWKVLGESYVAGKLGLEIDAAMNVNIGIWNAPPAKLAGGFFGVQVSLDLEVSVSLAILLTIGEGLNYMGFSVGVGVGLGGGATVLGGYTWVY